VFRQPLLPFIICHLTLLFSDKLEWFVPCDTHIRATGGLHNMWILVNLAILVLATLIAGAAAVAVYWLLLRATVELMRPAALSVKTPRQRAIAHSASSREGSK
jgi:hypothetical protein